jgi:two-component system, NarL family, response regulator NreC
VMLLYAGEEWLNLMIKIVLADDHQIVRKGLKALLGSESDFEIIGEASDGFETMEIVERLRPDIVVLDLLMPGMNGLEVTVQLAKNYPATGVVILSMHSNEAYIYEAVRSGARAYVLKDNTADELITAIRDVSAGRYYLGSSLPEQSFQAYKQRFEAKKSDPIEQLTPREQEILQLAIRGRSNSEIAAKLSISQRTVETHRTSLMRKLGVSNRNQLVHLALQRGIISAKEISPENPPQ